MEYSRRQAIKIMAHGSLLYTIAPVELIHAGQYSETIAALKDRRLLFDKQGIAKM